VAVQSPAAGVVIVERAGWLWDHAEQQPGRVLHHLPGMHLLHAAGAKPLQPRDLGGQVISVDIQVHPGRPLAKALH
jgi:hypothetical protein